MTPSATRETIVTRVRHPRPPQRRRDAPLHGYGVNLARNVKSVIHALVDEVESGDPCRHSKRENDGLKWQFSGHADPSARRRDAVREPQPVVARPGESLGVGICGDDDGRDGRKYQRQRVQHRRGEEENQQADDQHAEHVGGTQQPGG